MLSENETGMSTWGFVIFFLILFWFFGNGRAFGMGMAADAAHDGGYCHHSHQTERDALTLGRTIVEQNAATSQKLSEMAYASEAQTARILEGQKDLYIRDLERAATQMFITGQTSVLTNRLDALEAAGALARQNDAARIDARLDMIQASMLKAPAFQPVGGIAQLSCTNAVLPCNPCGCNG